MPLDDLDLQNGIQKRHSETAIEVAIETASRRGKKQ